jgi:polyisoprenyl-phosphate glycosyltransferase
VSDAITDVFVSVVAPLKNDAAIVAEFVDEVIGVFRGNYANYELVLVDDGSSDETFATITSLLDRYECVRAIRLSRSFGEEMAISAGLDTVIGDFVVVMLPNHDPPAMIPEFVSAARRGIGIVFGIRKSRPGESRAVRLGARFWYWYSRRFLDLDLPENSSQFRALSRQAVNAVVRIRDRYRYLRVLSGNVGYAQTGIMYEPINRNPDRPSRSFMERVGVSLDIIVSHSMHPLRAVTLLGLIGGGLNVLYALYVIATYIFRPNVAAGWTTLSLQNAGMFLLIFMILTVMSEYIGHILVESRDRPLYHVLEERNSPVYITDQNRRNVVLDSTVA